MKHFIEEPIPGKAKKTRRVFDKYTCDGCGAETKIKDDWTAHDLAFKNRSVTIKYTVAQVFDGAKYGKEYTYDICPYCFLRKVMPALTKELKGAEPRIKNWAGKEVTYGNVGIKTRT